MTMTITSFAEKAGYSPSTVSRAFNDSDRLKGETRQRILQLAREYGYAPNPAARRLKKGVIDFVGLVTASPIMGDSLAYAHILQAKSLFIHDLARRLEEQDLQLLLALSPHVLAPENIGKNLPKVLAGGNTHNIIIMNHMWQGLGEELRRFGRNPIVVNGPDCGCDAIQRDEIAAMETMIAHLYDMGHRRIAYMNLPPRPEESKSHYRDDLWPMGYFNALTQYQLVPVPGWNENIPITRALMRLLSLPHPPTAIVAYDDIVAATLIRMLWERGYNVPRDISVSAMVNVGMAQSPLCEITYVDFPDEQAARVAAQWITPRQQDADSPRLARLKADLIVGESTGPASLALSRRKEAEQ